MNEMEMERHRVRIMAMRLYGIGTQAASQFGEVAKFLQLITEEQLDNALSFQESCQNNGAGRVPKIGEVLMERGYIDNSELSAILEEQERFGSTVDETNDDTIAEIYNKARDIKEEQRAE